MLPRMNMAELCCARLLQHGSIGPVRCLSSRVLPCSAVISHKWSTTLFYTNKLQFNSIKRNISDSRTSARHYSIYDLCSKTHCEGMPARSLIVHNRSDTRLNMILKNKLCTSQIDSRYKHQHKGNNSVQNRISFSLSSPKNLSNSQSYLDHLAVRSIQSYSTSSDVRLMKHQWNNENRNSTSFPSCNGLSSVPTSGIHSTAVPLATDQPKVVDINPDFESTPSLPQRFVDGCPPSMKPYLQLLRIDRPIGTWLLFWPCGWGLALAAGPGCLPDPWMLGVFATGALVMRGAGCTINDLWDKDIDAKVSRTKYRPIASGAVNPFDAWVFLGAQLSLGLLVLLQLNGSAVLLGASSLGLVCVYPLVKRVSHWPQLVLGLTFNYGVLLGWCAVHGSVAPLPVLPLYAAGVCWTLVCDTIYAHQDKADDIAAGVKSTALRFGEDTALWLSGFSVAMVAGLLLAGQSAGLAWPYYGAVAATAANLVHQIRSLDIHNRARCGHQFRHNRHIGLLVFLGIVGGSVLAQPQDDATTTTCNCGPDGRCASCRSGANAASDTDSASGASPPLRVAILEA